MAQLLDSNILIYATQPGNDFLDRWLEDSNTLVSAISIAEVLGYPAISIDDEQMFEAMFAELHIQQVTESILRRAAALRRRRRIKLGDAIIAATALETGSDLVTRNEQDFRGIDDLQVVNPFAGRLSASGNRHSQTRRQREL